MVGVVIYLFFYGYGHAAARESDMMSWFNQTRSHDTPGKNHAAADKKDDFKPNLRDQPADAW